MHLNDFSFWKKYKSLKKNPLKKRFLIAEMEKQISKELFRFRDIIIAKNFRNRLCYIDSNDLESYANIGLAYAIKKYNPAKGKFTTYAATRIKGAVIDELRRESELPRGIIKKAIEIDIAVNEYYKKYGKTMTKDEIIKYMNLSKGEYNSIEYMLYLSQKKSLDMQSFKQGDSEKSVLYDFVEDSRFDPFEETRKSFRQRKVIKELSKIRPNRASVLYSIYFLGLRPSEIAEIRKVDRSTVSFIRRIAKQELATRLKNKNIAEYFDLD